MRQQSAIGIGCLVLAAALSSSCGSNSNGVGAGAGGVGGAAGDAGNSPSGGRAGSVSGAGRAGEGPDNSAGSAGYQDSSGGAPSADAGAAGAGGDAGAGGAPGVNAAPFVDPIPDAGIVLGQVLAPVVVHISDDLTPADAIVVSATSDNQALLKSSNIVVGAGVSAEYRTLTLTLEAGELGSATITVRGEDEAGLFRTRQFKVSVLAGAANLTELVSRGSSPDAVLGNGFSSHPSLSADGRLVAFASAASNLVPGDLGTNQDIFVYDRQSQLIKRLTKNSGNSVDPVISADGKHVTFSSDAANLVLGDTNALSDVFVYDLTSDGLERVSVADDEAQANGPSQTPDLSGDGNWVVWSSTASNLVSGDSNGKADIFVRDRASQTTVRLSVSSSGVQADGDSIEPQVSDDGSVFAFQSKASTLIDGSTDPNAFDDIFLRSGSLTRRISRNPTTMSDGDGYSERPALSGNGKVVAFASMAKNLVPGDDNAKMDIFAYDLPSNVLERISVTNDGSQSDGYSSGPALSSDGSVVVFDSQALDLAGANTGFINCYVSKRGAKLVVSLMNGSDFGGFANGSTNYRSVLSNDGKWVAFHSAATNLVVGDTNGVSDVFVTPVP